MTRDWTPTVDVLPHIHAGHRRLTCSCGATTEIDPMRTDDAFDWLTDHRTCTRRVAT
jgi:hypothetical protein